jgi:large subunit ribosomal protein L25
MSKVSNAISVVPRTDFGKGASRRARRNGQIPAIVYSKGAENRGFLINARDWGRLTRHEVGLVTLQDGKNEISVLIKDVQINTLMGIIVHIDFIEVKMDVEISAIIQVHAGADDPIGLAHGGVLEQSIHEIEVTCLPNSIPEGIDVDISGIDVEASMLAKDIVMPEGVKLASDGDVIVFRVNKPAAEAAAEAATEAEDEDEAAASSE